MQNLSFWIVLIVAIALLVLLFFVMRRINKKAEARQLEQQETMEQYKQTINMLVIDKKKLRIKDTDLPQQVKDSTPWYGSLFKMPIVKARVGTKMMTFIAEKEVFDVIPIKKEVKATVSGLYITNVRAIRGTLEKPAAKKGFFAKLRK